MNIPLVIPLKTKLHLKTIYGNAFLVPEWAKYAAIDESGYAYFYENKPEIFRSENWSNNAWSNEVGGDFIQFAHFDLTGIDWRETLVEIE